MIVVLNFVLNAFSFLTPCSRNILLYNICICPHPLRTQTHIIRRLHAIHSLSVF